MKKKALSLLLALTLCVGLAIPAMAATSDAIAAADKLHELGLFNGVGDNADGTPNYDLDRAPNRMEAVTLLVRLLGKEAEAQAGTWTTPFTDVADWAKPYVGYAYENGLTSGTSATTFSGTDTVSATQYLTFVLRALGYSSDSDFSWNSAWELTDELGITDGEYGATSAFTRGDAVIVSAGALDVKLKDGSKTLLAAIEEALANTPKVPTTEGNAGKIFTGTDVAYDLGGNNNLELYHGVPFEYALEIISAQEAIFSLKFDFPVAAANEYTIRIGPMHDGRYAYFNYTLGKFFADDFNASFTDTIVQDGLVRWRVILPPDCFMNFDMITDENSVQGFISQLLS